MISFWDSLDSRQVQSCERLSKGRKGFVRTPWEKNLSKHWFHILVLAAVLEDYQIKTYYPYGGTKVFITKEEMKEIKTFGEPGLSHSVVVLHSTLDPHRACTCILVCCGALLHTFTHDYFSSLRSGGFSHILFITDNLTSVNIYALLVRIVYFRTTCNNLFQCLALTILSRPWDNTVRLINYCVLIVSWSIDVQVFFLLVL